MLGWRSGAPGVKGPAALTRGAGCPSAGPALRADDQLPEVILACARVTGLDMVNKPRPAPADLEEAGLMTPGDVAAKCRELSAESMGEGTRRLLAVV